MPVIDLHGTPTYQGEVQLLGWSENNRDGMTVRLALDATDEGGGHPFKGLGTGKHGQRFMAVLVPVSDDPSPVAAQPAEQRGKPDGRKWDDMTYAQQAGIACGEPEFWAYLSRRLDNNVKIETADSAAAWVRWHCAVNSRAELDADREGPAAERWRILHGEYKRWRAGQREAESQVREYGR